MPDDKPEEPTIESLKEQLAAAVKEADKWKALSRKNEERATENADKASKFDALEQSSKTEAQKLEERLAKAEKIIAERDAKEAAKQLHSDIVKEKGLDKRGINANLLRGSSREELEAHADELLEAFPEKPPAPSADGQGVTGSQITEGDLSVDDIVAAATS